jgi:1-acyl-sn-glycerol-3-phosphate acyltransferase
MLLLMSEDKLSRKREPVTNTVLYHLFDKSIIVPILQLYFRRCIYGAENVPQKGAVVVVCNHASYFDPPILSSCMRRPVAYMAKEELFTIPIFKQAIQLYGAYPVKRATGDRGAIRAALTALQQGWMTGIFLSGTRTPDGRIIDPKHGAAAIAAKAQVPLLPVSLWNTEKILLKGSPLPHRVPISIRIGELIDPPTSTKRGEIQRVTDICTTAINTMHALGR